MSPALPSSRRAKFRIFLRGAIFSLAWGSVFAGGIEYPAGGNFDPEEGTLEMWLTPMTNNLTPPDDGKYHGILWLFGLEVPGKWRVNSPWYRHGKQLGPKVSARSEEVKDGLTAILPSFVPEWKAGQVHHYAFVWKGRNMAHFADGKFLGDLIQGTGFSGPLGTAMLSFGSYGKYAGSKNPMILHAVRISSVAMDPEALATSKPVAEPTTLLLDRFDLAEEVQDGKSTPEVSFTLEKATEGRMVGDTHFVSEPSPGLALYRDGDLD